MDQHPSVNNLYLSERLQKTLAGVGSHTVTTVIAPMGYGKSTALKWWQQQLAARIPHAKIFRQLVAADSRQDFWDGFCRALRPRPVLAGQLQALGFPADPHTMRLLHELLQDALAGHPDPVFFILDDVHLLQSVDLPGIVSFLAERLPPQVHIVLLSRNQIFSEAQKLRLGSRLLELGAADLRLTQEELLQYAGRCGLPLPEREAQALLSVSEGWIAMIYLMFRAYAQTGVWRFGAKGMDVLMEQVMFEPLDERRRFFLLDICMAEAFTAEQAAFVWREPDADALLHDLTHNNAFITTGDAGVYRCHHMLRMLLRRKFALLDEALQQSQTLRAMYDGDDRLHQLIDTARAIEGMPRHASTHAAGVVITEQPVYAYVPLASNDGALVCQFQMTTLEELGLLKMDFLGLRNLTVLEDAARQVRRREPGFQVERIPLDDKKTFDMLAAGRTVGVFQLESAGITAVCMGLRPRSIEDITAVIALYRPGPMESIPRFLACSAHPERITYKHPLLEPILSVTYGCIVYQEQVIEIFRQLAGFSLGQADMIRRAMSKKKEAVITAERAAFVHGDPERNIPGAVARGVPEQTANEIYDEILAFASYAFNKAHAVSYAIVSYRTAYMKRNYPHEYMAALLTSVLDNTQKVTEYIAECRELGIRLLPPDINASDADFTVEEGDLRFGLVAIKGVGRGLIQALMREREIGGPFTAFDEFCRRMNGHDLNRRAVESLIRAGCFDRMGYKRKALMQSVDRVLGGAASESRMNLTGQMNLFSAPDDGGAPADTTQLVLPDVEEFTRAELIAMERETTGLYLTGHPMDDYRALAQQAKAAPMGDILASFHAPATAAHRYRDGQRVVLAGICTASRERATRKNTRMAYLQLEDDSGSMEVLVFSPALDACRDLLAQETPALFVAGRISTRDESDPQLVADKVLPLTEQGLETLRTPPRRDPPPRPEPPKRHRLWVRLPDKDHPAVKRIELILEMFPGDEQLVLVFEDTGRRAAARCVVHPALVEELRELAGPGNVAVTEEKSR